MNGFDAFDPIGQMEFEAKRQAVEHDKKKIEARAKLEQAMRERVPEKYRKYTVRPLVFYPDEFLTKQCTAVEVFDKELAEMAGDMLLTMYLCGGVGLAAPQIGQTIRMFVCDWSQTRNTPIVLVNPMLVASGSEVNVMEEACLSIPGGKVRVERPRFVNIRYQDLKGKTSDVGLEDWAARVFLHELDHLDGKVMLDHVGRLERRIALRTLQKIKRRETAPARKRGGKKRR